MTSRQTSRPPTPDAELRRHALALRRAREQRVPIAPLTDGHPDLSVADAYRIARLGVLADVEAGARVVGHKIGLTAESVQRQLGVSEPDYGALLDRMRIDEGATLAAETTIAARVEVEVAFRLGDSLPPSGVTVERVRAATETVHAAIEVVDSRIADWRIALADTVADRGSAFGYVVKEPGRPLDSLDVTAVHATLRRDDQPVGSGSSAAVMGDPCVAVAWLANALGAAGDPLQAGEIVLSGAFFAMVSAQPGGRFRAEFSDGLGAVSVTIE